MLPSGNVLLFDNGVHRRGGPGHSRILEVDPATEEIVWQYQAEVVLAFISFMTSGAERQPNGNTLITEGATGRIFEVTTERETVWEYVTGFMPAGRFGKTPSMFRAHRYAADGTELAGRDLDPARWAEETKKLNSGEEAVRSAERLGAGHVGRILEPGHQRGGGALRAERTYIQSRMAARMMPVAVASPTVIAT